MEVHRCAWVKNTFEEYVKYHDEEWGIPVHDDRKHFEFLILEGAQAGLSWATILKKRKGYREAFAEFDPETVACFSEERIRELKEIGNIIRNEAKIRASVTNAQQFIKLQLEFGSFNDYVWRFTGGIPIINHWQTIKDVPAKTKESENLSNDLRKRGFKFVGSITMYAFMQACGLVNDHTMDCFRHKELS